jgi:hypothetical protein
VINQTTSTPGVLWEKIPVPTGSKFLTICYDVSSNLASGPWPYIRDLSGNVLYWVSTKTNLVSSSSNYICIKLNPGQTHLNIYFLAPLGRFKLGSSFSINNLSFDFTSTPNPSNLVVELYTHKKELVQTYLIDPPQDQKFIPNSFAYGCQWTRPGFVSIPSQLKSGYYFLKLGYKSKIYWSSLIIKPRFETGSNTKILLLANTNKWNAYNTWAGLDGSISLYTFVPTPYYQTNRNKVLMELLELLVLLPILYILKDQILLLVHMSILIFHLILKLEYFLMIIFMGKCFYLIFLMG